MSNIINNNFNNLKIRLNKDEYWDFFLCKDVIQFSKENNGKENCVISNIDISDNECIEENWIKGKKDKTWLKKVNTEYSLNNIGYTGFDNGLFTFRKDRILNSDFLKLYQDTKFQNKDRDGVLRLHKVSGSTLQYEYPLRIENNSIRLNGGFYQGYFETECNQYKILPTELEDEWDFEFTLKREDFEKESNKTLNDKYPNNKGFFFYIGTRAENKWVYLYDDSESECDALGIEEYVEDGEVDTKNYGINNFLDMSIHFPKTYFEAEAFTLMDYISYKYYDEKEYYPTDLDKDKFFIDDYIDIHDKPNIIDETKKSEKIIWGGCSQYNNTDRCVDDTNIPIEEYIVTCAGKRQIEINDESLEYMEGWYSGKNIFEDVDGLDIFEGETEYIEDDIDISNFEYYTNEGFKLSLSRQYKFTSDNKFLLFDRTCNGFTVDNWKEGTKIEFRGRKTNFKDNLFLLMNRTCTGYTIETIDQLRENAVEQYNIYNDLTENALGFRIKDDGSIGYRYCITDCNADTKCSFIEAYSKKGVIKENEWYTINIRMVEINSKYMKIYFYINGQLKFISKELPKLNLRKLDDLYEKQEGVPYNISIGGGTQGLIETILPNYMRNPYRIYPLEKNFAGTFIGYIKSFKFSDCFLNYS